MLMKNALIVAVVAAFTISAQAANVIIDEDYDSLSAGSQDPNWDFPGDTVTADGSNLFGAGNTNYLNIQTTGPLGPTDLDFTNDTGIVFYQFDFIINAPTHDEVVAIMGDGSWEAIDFRIRGDQGSFDPEVAFVGSTGASGSVIGDGKRYRIEFVTNTSGDTVNYAAGSLGTQTLADDRFDAYLFDYSAGTGSQIATDATFRNNVDITALSWRNHLNRDVDMKIDNVFAETLDEAPAIPEPASLAMGLFGLTLLAARRRRS